MAVLAVDILTPERRVMQTQADSVVVPAAEESLGAQPLGPVGHRLAQVVDGPGIVVPVDGADDR